MSRPVTTRLAQFHRTSNPSNFDEAVVGSIPTAVIQSVVASTITATATVYLPWATTSTYSTIALGDAVFPLSASGSAVTITNYESTLYDPFGIVAVSTATTSDVVVSQDGIYNIKARVNVNPVNELVAEDLVRLGLEVNGTFAARLDSYVCPWASLSTAGFDLQGDWTGPLTAQTTVSVFITADLGASNTLTVAPYAGWEGAQLVVARQATLVHVTPQ